KVEARCEFELDGFLREPVAVDRNLEPGSQDAQSLNVIGVFVRDENSAQLLGRPADPQQSLTNLARAQSGINQQPRVIRFEISAVAAGTAGEDRELDGHEATVGAAGQNGNL